MRVENQCSELIINVDVLEKTLTVFVGIVPLKSIKEDEFTVQELI